MYLIINAAYIGVCVCTENMRGWMKRCKNGEIWGRHRMIVYMCVWGGGNKWQIEIEYLQGIIKDTSVCVCVFVCAQMKRKCE